MTTYRITPKPGCPYCYSTGEVTDWVDYGSTQVALRSACECVTDQLPESFDDRQDGFEIVSDDPDWPEIETDPCGPDYQMCS